MAWVIECLWELLAYAVYIVWEGGGVIYAKVLIGEVGEDVGCILGILHIYLVSMLSRFFF